MRRLLKLLLFCAFLELSVSQFRPGSNKPNEVKYNGTYFLVGPKLLRKGQPYEASITVFQPIGRLELAIVESSNDFPFFGFGGQRTTTPAPRRPPLASRSLQNLNPGQKMTIILPTENVQFNPSTSYNLRATGFDRFNQKIFEQDDYISPDFHTESIFIQTDKAMYKPGSMVKYRVITVTPTMRPSRSTVSVKIKDQKQNVITQFLNQPLTKGVLSKELQLADEPPLGAWTISVATSEGNEATKTFTVEKYVLPKFEVEVDTRNGDKALTSDSITAKIKAKYTFGKPVVGPVTVTVAPAYYSPYNQFRGPVAPPLPVGDFDVFPSRPRYSGPTPVVKRGTLDQNGEMTVTFSNAELKESDVIQEYGGQLNVSALVSEPLTSEQREGFKMVQLFREPVRFEWKKSSQNFVPGVDYKLTMSLVTYDDKPLPQNFPRTVNLNITYYQKYVPPPPPIPVDIEPGPVAIGSAVSSGIIGRPYQPPKNKVESRTVQLDREGKATITLRGDANITSMQLQTEYTYDPTKRDREGKVQGYESIQAAESPSDNYLTITDPSGRESFQPGQNALFYVTSTEPIESISVLVVSKGKIVSSLDFPMGRTTSGQISVQATEEMAPRARVIAYKMRPENKEIIADSIVMNVAKGRSGGVQMSMSPGRAQPGETVTVRIRSNSDAFVGVLAVDKSVRLMGSNDITQDDIDREMEQYNYAGSGYPGPIFMRGRRKRSVMMPWFGGGTTANSVFQNAQVAVLTDAWLYGKNNGFRGGIMPFAERGGPMPMAVGGPMPAPMAPMPKGDTDMAGAGAFGGSAAPETRTRSVFPETWIWFDSITQGNGETVMTTTAPDTITTWLGTAFALDDREGLAVTPEATELEVFQKFFIRANLPYSVKRGEQLGLQVLVFSYDPSPQQVTVTLSHNASSGFDFADQNGNPIKAGHGQFGYNTRTVTVGGPGKSTADVFFPIIPNDIGKVKLRIEANSQGAADIVEKDLLVEPEGYTVEINKPLTIDLNRTPRFRDSVSVDVPQDIVPGSERAEVSVTGTVMGPAVQNVKSLVKMPTGCGEQNMVGFVPNIVVMRYMKASQQLEPALEQSAKRNMESGYQRELNYKHSDGSYSAFGESDDAGSTWLTAFVMKSFAQAKDYIFIDDDVIREGMQYLKEQQRSPGGFNEKGEVHHRELQGGSGSGVALTAFVLIAMLENKEPNAKAENLLESSLNSIANEPYTLSITTYALHKANSPMKDQAMQMMERAAIQENGTKFWKDRSKSLEYEQDKPDYWTKPQSTDVESTAYALLTYIERNDMQNALPVVRWLTNQRNPYGGFTSTQDTVVALQGLGAFAERAYRDGLRAQVQARSGNDVNSFQVDPTNAIVLQQAKVSNPRMPVDFEASGVGMVSAQLTVRYNSKRRKANDPFECSPNVVPKSKNDITISMCCRNKQPGETKLAVMEVNALSGYSIDGEDLKKLTSIPDLQRVETEKGNSQANIYFNKLGPRPTCFNISSSKRFDVAGQKPAQMSLYAYYSPEKRIQMEYSAQSAEPLSSSCPRCWEGQRTQQIFEPARNPNPAPTKSPWVWDAASYQWVLNNQSGNQNNQFNNQNNQLNNRNNQFGNQNQFNNRFRNNRRNRWSRRNPTG